MSQLEARVDSNSSMEICFSCAHRRYCTISHLQEGVALPHFWSSLACEGSFISASFLVPFFLFHLVCPGNGKSMICESIVETGPSASLYGGSVSSTKTKCTPSLVCSFLSLFGVVPPSPGHHCHLPCLSPPQLEGVNKGRKRLFHRLLQRSKPLKPV